MKLIGLRCRVWRNRSLIKTVNDQLKNACQIEYTRHCSPANFFVNLLAALIAYTQQPKKPKINFDLPTDLRPKTLAVMLLQGMGSVG